MGHSVLAVLLFVACAPPVADTSDTALDHTGDPDDTADEHDTGDTSETGDTDDTGTADPCDGVAVCDDFEADAAGGPPGSARWHVVTPNCGGSGTVVIDDAVSHSGTRSVRVDGPAGYCNHVFVETTADVDGLGDNLWGRLWLRIDEALGADHVTIATFSDRNDGDKDLRLGGQSGILMWNRESDDATLPALSPAGIALSTAPPALTWLCIEYRIDASGGLYTWVDGSLVEGLVVDGSASPEIDEQWLRRGVWQPDVVTARFGWESYAGSARTLWLDDVALAGARVGCGS